MATQLTIRHGAGAVLVVPDEAIPRTNAGTARDALLAIAHALRDQSLRAIVLEPDVVVDAYIAAEDKHGLEDDAPGTELPVNPDANFAQILQLLERCDVELGVARRHTGGADCAPLRHCGDAAQLRHRFRRQDAVAHPEGYELADDDRRLVAEGRAIFITGDALAAAEEACGAAGDSMELFWYWVARSHAPHLVIDLVVPDQTASADLCSVDARDVLSAARRAARAGCVIVGAGHSHGKASVFTSFTDTRQIHALAAEQAGVMTTAIREYWEQATPVARAGGNGSAQFAAGFPAAGCDAIVETAAPDGAPPRMCLRTSRRLLATTFSTSNTYNEHLFPVLATRACPACGVAEAEVVPPEDVTVHVVGPVELPAGRRERLMAEVGRRLALRRQCETRAQVSGYCRHDSQAPATPTAPSTSGAFRYAIYLGTEYLASVDPDILRDAGAAYPPLAEALGWRRRVRAAEQTAKGSAEG